MTATKNYSLLETSETSVIPKFTTRKSKIQTDFSYRNSFFLFPIYSQLLSLKSSDSQAIGSELTLFFICKIQNIVKTNFSTYG